jgi:Tol biopolymer transport system component
MKVSNAKLRFYEGGTMRRFQLIYTRSIVTAMFVLSSLLLICSPAHATFPGKNGRIAFIMGPDLYTMNPDGSGVKQLTSLGNTGTVSWEGWSADGSQIVFDVYAPNQGPGALWLMNADGTNRHLLLKESAFDEENPSFSPDGTQVAFSKCKLPDFQPCAMYRIGVDGGGLTAITHFSSNVDLVDGSAAYSPDGNTIAFANFSRGGIIAAEYLMNADGTNIRQLTAPVLEASFDPDWSPDGTRIVFSTRAFYPPNTITPQLWVTTTDGMGATQLTFPGVSAADTFVSWSPQGNAIVFERDNATGSALYVLNLDGAGAAEKLIFQRPSSREVDALLLPSATVPHVTKKRHLRQVESGGLRPRWGSSAN